MKAHHIARRLLPKRTRDRAYSWVSKSLYRVGFIPQLAAGPVDFRGLDIAPDEALRRAAGVPCLIDIAPEHLRNVGPATGASYFPCIKNVGNPFIETILQYLNGSASNYDHSLLKRYHDEFQPESIAGAFGIEDNDKLHFLLRQPAALAFPPWVRPPIDDYQAHLRRRYHNIAIENRANGKSIGHEQGHGAFGPVGKEKGRLEIDRLVSITDSIKAKGYQQSGFIGGIQVAVLKAGRKYRFLCYNGHHRTSALSALGHTTISAFLIGEIINRDDMPQWPGVRASVFTPEQALEIFDMFFHGRPPEAAVRWWRELKAQDQDVKMAGSVAQIG